MADWIVLRIPRSAEATQMSGVLSANAALFTERGATIAAVCDALVAHVPESTPRLIVPLDGRHGLAGEVLDEATKRGWEFGRHPPAGSELHVLDLGGPDAATSLATAEATALLEKLVSAMGEAWDHDELGESMGIGRQAMTLSLHHFGAWHPYTYWVMSNLFQTSAGTGNADNIREASAFVDHLLAHDAPDAFVGAQSSIVRLDELAHRCMGVSDRALAARVYDTAIVIARGAFGDGSTFHQQVLERKAASLA
ncbi:MAG: hypothetical protein ACKV2T_17380 [Kofleriaceae bacterium]